MANANLDALIEREDFEAVVEKAPSMPTTTTTTIQVRDLESASFFFQILRKPDFQRETSEWEATKISEFVRSFLSGDLIPAIILWRSNQFTFVIDGAHRLSALIAWVNDDYGDGLRSRSFFSESISEGQLAAARRARDVINKAIGTYQQHRDAIAAPSSFPPELVARARNLGVLAIQLQWVTGDSKKAESSFFKINQSASPIDKTELRLLQSRQKPDAIAARAIMRAGTGHKYWAKFSEEKQKEIEKRANDVYQALLLPELKTPIKTLDLPVAGRGYSSETLSLVVDFVGISNNKLDAELADDGSGDSTLEFLEKCRSVARRISGNHGGSLALHPAVYFYSLTGRHQRSAFLAVTAWVMQLDKTSRLDEFTTNRANFERVFMPLKHVLNQIVRKLGSATRSYVRILEFLGLLLSEVSKQPSIKHLDALSNITKLENFSFLDVSEVEETEFGTDFNTEAKSAVFLRDALANSLKCGICGGSIHGQGVTIDHIEKKMLGGKGVPSNGQLAHPYCNNNYKG